jgi:hypothetical protein
MFVRHVKRLEAIRARRLLDRIQVQAVPHMRDADRRSFIDRLVDDAAGVVADAALLEDDGIVHERVIWNRKVLHTTREIKQAAFSSLAKGLVA